jgi:hypothetical protein
MNSYEGRDKLLAFFNTGNKVPALASFLLLAEEDCMAG